MHAQILHSVPRYGVKGVCTWRRTDRVGNACRGPWCARPLGAGFSCRLAYPSGGDEGPFGRLSWGLSENWA